MSAGSSTRRVLKQGFDETWRFRPNWFFKRRAWRQNDSESNVTGKDSFEALVGSQGWQRLSPAIRARFACHAGTAEVLYHGAMRSVRCSRAGYLLAQLCRLFGTPLAPFQGRDIPVEVRVRADTKRGGVAWDRVYFFPDRQPVTVTSTKVFTGDGKALLECVGGGFGMRLKVFEQDGELHFLSQSYFWRFAGLSVPLPDWLTPGVAHVVHSDLGAGWFRFEMTMRHGRLGETFYQDGRFKEKE